MLAEITISITEDIAADLWVYADNMDNDLSYEDNENLKWKIENRLGHERLIKLLGSVSSDRWAKEE